MKLKIQQILGIGLTLLIAGTTPLGAQERTSTDSETVPITLDRFATAETDHLMQVAINTFDCLGKWGHLRGFTPIDKQNVVRMNRDTLYSSMVLDLTTPATLIKPDTHGRYQSLLVVNEAHFVGLTAYEPGEYKLTKEEMGSRYVAVIARTLVDAEDPDDLAAAQKAQDGLQVIQKAKGVFEVPNWDPVALEEMREELKTLGKYLPNRDKALGTGGDDTDPVAHLVATADAWGGWQPENAVFLSYVPRDNDGNTPYTLTLNDVPAGKGAFWSISVYNKDGYFQKNKFDKYVINSRKAKANKDGSITIHFGGDASQPNFLPIMRGWNYIASHLSATEALL